MEPDELVSLFLRQQLEVYGDGPAVSMPSLPEKTAAVLPAIEINTSTSLDDLAVRIHDCLFCGLGASRTQMVFGSGNPQAEIVLVGEAPGGEEAQQGLPFMGEAGQLLGKMLAAVHWQREQIYLCNVLKCRPPGNRDPLPDEINTCLPYLKKQLELVHPKFILCLGRFSAHALLNQQVGLKQLRGKVHRFMDAQVVVTYHPATLLRYPQYKKEAWEDLKLFRRIYDDFIKPK